MRQSPDTLRSEVVEVPGFWECWGTDKGLPVTDTVRFYAKTTAHAEAAARGLWVAFDSPGYALQRESEWLRG